MEEKAIEARAEMLIRKPVAQVFKAIIDPEVTKNFWFTKGSGLLEIGKRIRWDWEMYGVFTHVDVKAIEENRRILMEWDEGDSTVEWLFVERGANETYLTVINRDFRGSHEEVIAKALDSTAGFTIVLAGLKAWLEHGIRLNLVADKYPDANVK